LKSVVLPLFARPTIPTSRLMARGRYRPVYATVAS
jgi:hypothetical protein